MSSESKRWVILRCSDCDVRSEAIDRMQEPGHISDLRWWREHLTAFHDPPDYEVVWYGADSPGDKQTSPNAATEVSDA